MKKMILGTFPSRPNAESLVAHLRNDMGIAADDISYIYRGTDGEVKEVGSTKRDPTAGEDVTAGAVVGGSLGALAGLATVAGIIPVIGPIFAAGPIIAALGLGGAAGLTAAGALTGALAGGIAGGLLSLGVSKTEAEAYEERIRAGDVLVVVHAENDNAVSNAFEVRGAGSIHVYKPAI